jgi:hypothetical protein
MRRGDLTADDRDYHDVLVTLIVQCEEEHHPPGQGSNSSPARPSRSHSA